MRSALRVRHYALRTERAYVDWVRRFIRFHGQRHPAALGAEAVTDFLTHLAVERQVTSSTQHQAKAALLFLYGQVLGLNLPELGELVAAPARQRLPVVLTPAEVRALLGALRGAPWLVASLLYGTGLRLLEGLRLRAKDVDFKRRELLVRASRGGRDRVVALPESLLQPLMQQLARVQALHEDDLAAGYGEACLPPEVAIDTPAAARSLGWQWLFPGATLRVDPAHAGNGEVRRHPLQESVVQRAMAAAAERAGIGKPCSAQVLRHSFAAHRLQAGLGIPTLQALLGHRDVRTTLVYAQALNGAVQGACSPADGSGVPCCTP